MPILYAPLSSAFLAVASAANCVVSAQAGLAEARGTNMAYSKFSPSPAAAAAAVAAERVRLPSRVGMLLIYTPALAAAAAAAFGVPGALAGVRGRLLCSALFLHFLKRDLEVLFIHRYSGEIPVDSVITISLSYLMSTSTMIYSQYLVQTQGLLEPALDLKYAGVALFLVGITGNFYHHHLLSELRNKRKRKEKEEENGREYSIPKGGLFGLVVCPHYLFEVIVFVGIALISQTLFAFSVMAASGFYLMGRSYATRRWYLSRFKDFPAHVKALIPYLF